MTAPCPRSGSATRNRVVALFAAAGCAEPSISDEEMGLWIGIAFSEAYRKLVNAGEHASKSESVRELTTELTTEVTTEVGRLLHALKGDMARRDVQTALALHNAEYLRSAYLVPALEAGLIAMTVPDKPTSRLQKYRLTAKGRKTLAALSDKGGAGR